MNSTAKRVGRKPKHFVTSDNVTVNGLIRQPDGRWRIMATGARFTEPDERLAVAHYLRLTGQGTPVSRGELTLHAGKENWPEYDPNTSARIAHLDEPAGYAEIMVPPAVLWAYVRRELLSRPKWVAQQVGIEQVGYLTDLRPPERVPSLDELETIWKNHANIDAKQVAKVLRGFQHFRAHSAIKVVDDITAELVVSYRDKLHKCGLSSKSQQHIINGIKRIFSFAKGRAVAVDTLSKVLNTLSILSADSNATALDPQPISAGDYKALLSNSAGDDRAMILFMLNGAFSIQEVIRLKWSDIKEGTITTRRTKQGNCIRVCVLWPETVEALTQVKRKGDHIFVSNQGMPVSISRAHARFADLRTAARVPHVCSNHLRDGAYTAAVEANVSGDLCRLLAGHRTGMSDHYVARKPKMVAPACEAIRKAYDIGN